MKRSLVAVSLTFALLQSASIAAPEAQESITVKIDLENVSSLNQVLNGEVDVDALPVVETVTVIEVPQPQVSVPPIEMTAQSKPEVLKVPKQEERISSASPKNAQVISTEVKQDQVKQERAKRDDGGIENFQPFEAPDRAIDYRTKSAYWAEKAPKATETYSYSSRVAKTDLQKFHQLQQDPTVGDATVLVTVKGLTPKGEALYTALLESEGLGLLPQLYHVGRIENLLQSGDVAAHQAELVALLTEAGLSYVRDIVQGMPEVKKQDKDWLLEGRNVDVADTYQQILLSDDIKAALSALEPQYKEYRDLKRALLAFKLKEQSEEPAIVPQGTTIKPGMGGERVKLMRDRLNYLGYNAGNGTTYDSQMVKAVKDFQRTHLLEPDGAAGKKTIVELNRSNAERIQQIQINLERWRWMPETMGEHFVAVDIPGFRYEVVKDGETVLSARTVVGREGRKTPVFMSPMSYIVFSPYWHVPRSMAVNDFLPRLKRNPYALTGSKIRIFRNGQEIDPGTVDWSQYSRNNFPFQLRQDPGDYNSLGRVKFMFPNEHAIYLHDTPSKSLFNRTSRDFSSGCVRIENPEELAEYFLGEAGWNQSKIKSAFRQSKESHVGLAKDKKIPVYTLYMTTRVKGDSISFRADIYNKDQVLIKALNNLSK
ncbi:murein L,D-transpeptidase [Ignatzschineria ureiclastica]|uniref:Murein L,D-transpeptidase n=1 Tax=Ignatzschineria ureiclastica TaxID=472582 RepID=A0A2U2AER0_9GAMM|nr:L,D-transpeptidase family protein [Ignatzschineria ureiclastica]PWD81151.1 murein L,D-transpeptidase [Ignatzschineria ureiclastica]GGZ96658.1 hypothetical protein GCM10007162_10940 [Ignatzschineria ureiclastica]